MLTAFVPVVLLLLPSRAIPATSFDLAGFFCLESFCFFTLPYLLWQDTPTGLELNEKKN